MVDNTNWLRSFGRSRSSTPTIPTIQHHSDLSQTRHGFDTGIGAGGPFLPPPPPSPTAESPPRSRKSASATLRSVSSFLSLKSSAKSGHASPSEPEPVRTPAPLAMLPLTEVDYYGRSRGSGGGGLMAQGAAGEEGPRPTWHNPSVMQVAEMLGAVMAKSGAGKSLPVAYNSSVLSLIEAFYSATRKLQVIEEELAELENLREKELEQFRGMSEEWMETSAAYKAEIKRLELALALESKDGVACVALARHGSLVDRAGSKLFQARLKRLSNTPDSDIVETVNVARPAADPVDLLEATTSYRTLGAIPRILDSESDVLVSRIVEQREMYELRDRRRHGRVRAAPVLIRPRGGRGSRGIGGGVLDGQQSGDPAMSRDADVGTAATGDGRIQPDDTPRPKRQTALPTDSKSGSSGSESSRETFSAPSSSRSSRRSNRQRGWANKKYLGWPGRAARQRKAKLSQLDTESREQSKPSKPDQLPNSPSPVPKQRKRGYSFEKGAEEVLSVTSPTWASEDYSNVRPPAGVETTAQPRVSRPVAVTIPTESDAAERKGSDCAPPATALPPALSSSPSSITHSASTGTVRWVGDGGVDAGVAGHGKRDGTG